MVPSVSIWKGEEVLANQETVYVVSDLVASPRGRILMKATGFENYIAIATKDQTGLELNETRDTLPA
jgi:hypothetical protein